MQIHQSMYSFVDRVSAAVCLCDALIFLVCYAWRAFCFRDLHHPWPLHHSHSHSQSPHQNIHGRRTKYSTSRWWNSKSSPGTAAVSTPWPQDFAVTPYSDPPPTCMWPNSPETRGDCNFLWFDGVDWQMIWFDCILMACRCRIHWRARVEFLQGGRPRAPWVAFCFLSYLFLQNFSSLR